MKQLIIFLILFFTLNIGISQNELYILLDNSYINKDNDSLNCFFDLWEQDSNYNNNTNQGNSSSDTINDIINLYSAFINSFENEIHENYSEYFIVQNLLIWEFDELCFDSKTKQYFYFKDSIVDFKPNILLKNRKVLYSIPKYTNVIKTFLGDQNSADNLMAPNVPILDTKSRNEWIDNKVKVYLSHWGDYWNIESEPYIIKIELKNTSDSANILYSYRYSGGHALFKKVNNKWILIKRNKYFIE